jgi:hypothetical protein
MNSNEINRARNDEVRTPSDQVNSPNVDENAVLILDSIAWFGVPFPDLDCRHWLPFLVEKELGQVSPKITLPLADDQFATDWALPPETLPDVA